MKFSTHRALDMTQIGDAPTIVNVHAPDGTLIATVYGENAAVLIMSLLNKDMEEALKPENQGEDK